MVANFKKSIFLWINTPYSSSTIRRTCFEGDVIRCWRTHLAKFQKIVQERVAHSYSQQQCIKEEKLTPLESNGWKTHSKSSPSHLLLRPNEHNDTNPLYSTQQTSHAYYQGQVIIDCVKILNGNMTKREVIENICKLKYRTAQRKIRLAKHIEKFPEMKWMTQTQAECYLSRNTTRPRNKNDAENHA
jgi:hypothetical protein